MRLRPATLLALGLAAAACAEPAVLRNGVRIPVGQAVAADLERAQGHLDADKPEAARSVLEAVLADLPESRRNDEVLYRLGEIYVRLGDLDGAAATWRKLLDRYPRSRREARARLGLAELYRAAGRPELARDVLEETHFERAPDALRGRIYRLLADLAREQEDFAGALLWLAYTRRETQEEEDLFQLDLEIAELLEGRLLDPELERLSGRLPGGSVRDRTLLELARRSIARGDPDAALDALDALPGRLRSADEAERDRLLAQAQIGSETALRSLGLVLPLSGEYADYGQAVLRGFALRLGVLDEEPTPYRVLVRDSAGDPQRAASAVRELADEGVLAIVGPLRSVTAASAAPEAQAVGVPLLTLAQRQDLESLGDSVFRLGLTPSDQVRSLARYAFEVRDHRRFAILYPRDAYGTTFKNLFWDEVLARGGEIVGVEGYEPATTDLQAEIKKLVGLYYLTDEEQKIIRRRDHLVRRPQDNAEELADPMFQDLPPYVDFDALFIPDEAPQVGLILPQLRFYDVRDATLLGPSGWNDPALLEIAGRDARGAIFIGAFFAQSAFPFVQDFVGKYYASYGEEPDYLAAEGYDVAAILRSLMDSRRHTSRRELQRGLHGVRDFPGVSGLTTFDDAGGTHKELYLLTVRRGSIEELDSQP